MNWMLETIREGLGAMLTVAGPIILVAAAIGVTLGIIQTVTSVQDQTTQHALKLTGVSLVIIVGGVWMFAYLSEFTKNSFDKSFKMVEEHRETLDPSLFESNEALMYTFTGAFAKPPGDLGNTTTSSGDAAFSRLTQDQGSTAKDTFASALNGLPKPAQPVVPAPRRQDSQYQAVAPPERMASQMPAQESSSTGRNIPIVKPVLPDEFTDTIAGQRGDPLPTPVDSQGQQINWW